MDINLSIDKVSNLFINFVNTVDKIIDIFFIYTVAMWKIVGHSGIILSLNLIMRQKLNQVKFKFNIKQFLLKEVARWI